MKKLILTSLVFFVVYNAVVDKSTQNKIDKLEEKVRTNTLTQLEWFGPLLQGCLIDENLHWLSRLSWVELILVDTYSI